MAQDTPLGATDFCPQRFKVERMLAERANRFMILGLDGQKHTQGGYGFKSEEKAIAQAESIYRKVLRQSKSLA